MPGFDYALYMIAGKWSKLITVLSLFALALPEQAIPLEQHEIRIGVLADRGADFARMEWQDTLSELAAKIPATHFNLVPGSLSDLSKAVANHDLDFLITNPGHFLELQIDYGASGLATSESMDGAPPTSSTGMALVVLADQTDFLNLDDLRNRLIAAASPESLSYHIATKEFLDHGFDLARQASLLFTGIPADSVINAVVTGKAQAGIVRACALENMIEEGKVKADLLRVIAQKPSGLLKCQVSSKLYPGWALVKTANTPAALASRVQRTLLDMQPGSTNLFWTALVDNDPVQELYRALKIGPYERFRSRGMLDFLWENRFSAALFGVILIWWIVHVLRVEYLIARRTRELREAHDQARMRGEQMEHAVRLSLMGEMASSLAHEINQPIGAILNYARGCEHLLEGRTTDLEPIRQGVQKIAAQAKRAGAIVHQMRDFVKKRPSNQIVENPVAVLKDAMLLFEPVAIASSIKIDVDIPKSLPFVRLDRVQIEEVILNLLQNAVEAVAGGSTPHVGLRASANSGELTVTITDNGPGLTSEAKAHLFEAFYTTKPSGLGLGLSLSRTIIEAHGGRLWAEASQRDGTAFGFTLPITERGEECSTQRQSSISSTTIQTCATPSVSLSHPSDTTTSLVAPGQSS